MRPITHPLALAKLRAERAYNTEKHMPGDEGPMISCDVADDNWKRAGSPIYLDPTPLPPPALGMRVWMEGDNGAARATDSQDVKWLRPGETWGGTLPDPDEITLITDYRTGEILWRRA